MSTLNSELAELDRQFLAAKADASELVSGLNESQFNWRPGAGRWSMAENLLHLNIVADRYVHVLEKTIAEARTHGLVGQGPFGCGWLGKWILAHTEPAPRHKYKAPRSFRPADGQPITAVLPTFRHLQDQLSQRLEQSNGLDLRRVKAPALEIRPLRFNLLLTFAWIAAHQRRHLWQARQVLGHAGFPKAG
jgi:hypothetical protein